MRYIVSIDDATEELGRMLDEALERRQRSDETGSAVATTPIMVRI